MKTSIFYFSATGNCLKVTRDLARELGDAELINIAKVNDSQIILTADRVGIIFPVYMFGMPLIVSRFIKKLKADKDKYIFAIATCGGKAANSLGQTEKELEAIGLKLSAGFIIKMPGNYIPLYGALPESKQQEMFSKEAGRIKEIGKIVRTALLMEIEKDLSVYRGLFSWIYKIGSKKIPAMDSGFWVNEKCNSCGSCVRVCPVENIELIEGKPRWFHKCEQCMACLQWCPQEAIQYGKKTTGRKRYHNPETKLQDLLLK